MSAHEPPATVTRQWCPACGRTFVGVIPSPRCHLPPGIFAVEWCHGTVQTLTYELRAEPQRTREEMIEDARLEMHDRSPVGANSRDAEAVLIAAGVIEAAPDA